MTLAKTKSVHAMHDATEGGLTAALNELAEASNTGFRLNLTRYQLLMKSTRSKKHFRLSDNQVLSMSSTGTILAAVNPEGKTKVETTLRQNGIEASIIGVFTKNKRRILMRDDQETPFPREADDPYARILSGLV